jgi:hypothetical protein
VFDEGTVTAKDPLSSVVVPWLLPFTTTLTPGIGAPFSSVTFPVTRMPACAKTGTGEMLSAKKLNKNKRKREKEVRFINSKFW